MKNETGGNEAQVGVDAHAVRRVASWMSRDMMTMSLSIILATVLLLGIAFVIVDPTPPKRLVISAGLEGSVYQRFAEQYKAILARQHVDLVIRGSAGSMQNLRDLSRRDQDADVAFIQSGTSNDNVASRRMLVSLGSLFVEPVWLFYRPAALGSANGPEASGPPRITRLEHCVGCA